MSRLHTTLTRLFALLTILTLTPLASAVGPGPYKVVQDDAGKFWFADAKGTKFLSLGVNHIADGSFNAPEGTRYYNGVNNQFNGDAQAWVASCVEILESGGFNTVGAWSDARLNGCGLLETVILYAAGHEHDRVLDGLRPGFEQRVRDHVETALADWPDRKRVLGYFIDNEAAWYGRIAWVDEPTYTLLELALSLEPDDPARVAAVEFITGRYAGPHAFAQAWGVELSSWDELSDVLLESAHSAASQRDRAAFIERAADAWFKTTTAVIRELEPNALILGVRFAGDAPDPVIEACGKYCDVVSYNNYVHEPEVDDARLARYWLLGGKPMMRTEYSWRAEENRSGNPNSRGAGNVVATQRDRARNYRQYVEALLARPGMIGAHWFEFADQSPDGRFDGEDSNYGMVDIYHEPYDALINAMRGVNTRADQIHAGSDLGFPTELPEAKAVTLFTGQYPDRPATLDLLADPVAKPAVFHDGDATVKAFRKNEKLHVHAGTGGGWGGGFHQFGPRSLHLPRAGFEHATDLAGYQTVVLDLTAPVDFRFNFFLDEAGVAPPGSAFDPATRDDGESYASVTLRGAGQRQTYTVNLNNLIHRNVFGNQNGNRRIDIHSVKGVGLIWNGQQGEVKIVIHGWRLEK